MPTRNRDYHKDIQINPNDLETAWIEHSSLYLYYAEAHAEATDTRDRNKQNLELIQAQLDQKFRKKWDILFPDTKMTEGSIKAVILQDILYKKALDLYNKASHNVNLMSVAKTAFEHRKKAIEGLVTMKVSGFYSAPKSPLKKMGGSIHAEHTRKLNNTRLKRNKKSQD
jgi:hypothetical protein